MATGFDHSAAHIKGLEAYEDAHDSCNVFIHAIDKKKRALRNYWHGFRHQGGDFICYSPKFPYKGEGTDFYALYYEHFLRFDKMHQTSSMGSRLQYWTPNKCIYQMPYANEVALDECHKRNIDVMLGWEMLEVKTDEHQQKIAVFQNVDTHEIIEKPFFTACINPKSIPQPVVGESGLGDHQGLMDVNKYTL